MSTRFPKNPYRNVITIDEKQDIHAIERLQLPYIYCCRNPEYGTVGFANPNDPMFWLDYMIFAEERDMRGMADIDIDDFHDHPLCEGKSEEEILSLYKELLDAYRKFAPRINQFWEKYGKSAGSMYNIWNGSFVHGLDFILSYKDTESFKDDARKVRISTNTMSNCFMMRMREIKNDIMLILKKAIDNGWEPESGLAVEPEEQEAPELMVSKIAMPYVYIRLDAYKMADGISAPEKKRNWAVGFPKDNNAGDAWFEYLCKPGQFPSKINIGDFAAVFDGTGLPEEQVRSAYSRLLGLYKQLSGLINTLLEDDRKESEGYDINLPYFLDEACTNTATNEELRGLNIFAPIKDRLRQIRDDMSLVLKKAESAGVPVIRLAWPL